MGKYGLCFRKVIVLMEGNIVADKNGFWSSDKLNGNQISLSAITMTMKRLNSHIGSGISLTNVRLLAI